jgi:molybdopterin converting factor small subunit
MRVKVIAPVWCDSSALAPGGFLEVAEGSCLRDALRPLKLPPLFARLFRVHLNGSPAPLSTPLAQGDVIAFFSGLHGG